MDIKPIENIIASLRKGEFPDVQPWDLSAAVRDMADSLARIPALVKTSEIRAACKALNNHRQFHETTVLGQTWGQNKEFDAEIGRRHAQALINLSALDAAEQLLVEGLEWIKAPDAGVHASSEILEYEGLLGRIKKQRFVVTGDNEFLLRATDQYQHQYDADPTKPYWHGINAIALRAREEREGLRRNDAMASEVLAARIYKQVLSKYKKDSRDPWLASTLSEASLALGKCDQAELWLYRFLHHPKVQPFDLDSYGRQLREIWGGNALGGGNSCADRLALIMSQHLMQTQKSLTISTQAVRSTASQIESNPALLEKNFSGEHFFGLETIKRMLDACGSIGCVVNKTGERLGTGFVVKGSTLGKGLADTPVFITNAHVISDTVPNAIPIEEARVTFEVESTARDEQVFYKVKDLIFTSPPGNLGRRCPNYDELDVTIVTLEGLRADNCPGLKTAASLPLIDKRTKAYVVGHPQGSGLQFSLHDSLLVDFDDEERLVHYRTPTEPGTSGSPVFNSQWQVIAVHHGGSSSMPRLRGVGQYEANEGIAFNAIRRRLSS